MVAGSDKIQFDIAFQNGTFKYAVSKDYGDTKKQAANRTDIEKHWVPAVESVCESGMKLNKPRTRARVSITKQWSKDWWKNPIKDVADKIKEEFDQLADFEKKVRNNKKH